MAGGKKLFKFGRIVVLLTGKHAGKKAVIIKVMSEGTKDRAFPHMLVVGMARNPKKVSKKMTEERIAKRIRIKPFVKYVNMNHVMPTRYMAKPELELNQVLKDYETQAVIRQESTARVRDPLANADIKTDLKNKVKRVLEKKYRELELNDNDESTIKLKFFFKTLRF